MNTAIDRSLVPVRPVAAVCHQPDFNKTACDTVEASWTNSIWRASEPGAVQWANWEAWPEHNESCYLNTSTSLPCRQGRISLYSALARSASHIQHAVTFAKRHNLRLVIKNSGHSYLGRSTAPDSLQISTTRMKSIQFTDNFVPAGCPEHKGEGHAVTLEAGAALKELYTAAAERSRTVIAGASYTVGAAGGYIQGGGHSPFGTWKGMASDNALEFQVVTANVRPLARRPWCGGLFLTGEQGELVYANAYQNTDLFWALRGGGGGSFGVVVNVTMRTFPEVPVVMSALNISAPAESSTFWDAVTKFLAALPDLNGAGGSGYYFLTPQYNMQDTKVSAMALMLLFANRTDTASIDRLYHPLVSALNETSGVMTQYASFPLPNISTVFSTILLPGPVGTPDVTGAINLAGSRLFSRDLLVSKDGPARLAKALKSLGTRLNGHVVAGGAVAENGETVDSALNPAWRKTITHIAFGRSWGVNATLEEIEAVRDQVTNVDVPALRAVEGEDKMGAYLNEANAYETDFQESFWGENYGRLYRIKQKWDPTGLFISRKGVGSEDWDNAGLCTK